MLAAANTFRHGELPKATSSQDAWYYVMLIGSCLFFFDVFFRRVQVSFTWVPPLLSRVFRREMQPAEVETMQRLRSRKAEVTGRIEQLRADARFEAPPETAPDAEISPEAIAPGPAKPAAPSLAGDEKTETESYTDRLLRAKEEVRQQQKKMRKEEP